MTQQELQADQRRVEEILRNEPDVPEKELALIGLRVLGGLLLDIKRIADAAEELTRRP